LELTESYAVSFSDAAYHAIAIVHNGLFVTSDTRYINKVVGAAAVVTLSDWQPPRAIPRRGR
jgi:predicted nucleic acid-binding protein